MTSSVSKGIRADIHAWTPLHWAGVVLSVGIAAVNLYVGYTAGETALAVVGCSFLVGIGLFFTRFWQPVLYLLGILHIAILGVLWVLSGMEIFGWGLLTGVLSLCLGAIALTLFFREERGRDSRRHAG